MLQSTQSSIKNKNKPLQNITESHKGVSYVPPYTGKLKSVQFIDQSGIIKNEISHFENDKHMATFDRIVLGGHEPSHHFSAGILKMLGTQTGRIFGVWNENAVSSFLAGTRVYPENSYSYKTIKMDRREDFIKNNYFFLNLKHLSEREDFRDAEKVILTNPEDKKFWEKELPKIITDALPSVPALKEVAQLFNEIGKIINQDYSNILDQATMTVNGSKEHKVEFKRLNISTEQNTHIIKNKGQETKIAYPEINRDTIQGIIDWEFNPLNMKSDKFDAKEITMSISEASREARNNNRDMNIEDIKKALFKRLPFTNTTNLKDLEHTLKKKYPTKNNGINPTQTLRQSVALDTLKALDKSAEYLPNSEYKVEYTINQEAVSEAYNDERIRSRIDKINDIYKELPMWIRRSTYYLPKH